MVQVDHGREGVRVERVDELYREYERMDRPALYADGGVNPYAGRCKVIPRKATYYTMAQGDAQIEMARLVMRGLAKRRKVREVVCTKTEINYNQFAKAGEITVLYV